MRKNFTLFFGILVFLTFGIAVPKIFAQCDNYFKTNYRAVNKIGYINNGAFLLNDWNGDGRSDFWNLRLNTSTATKDILIYPGKATGYWDWDNPIIYTTNILSSVTTSSTIGVRDFTGDGNIDLYLGDNIYRNNGNGTFTALAQITTVTPFIARVGFYDLNGDNLLDRVDKVSSGIPGQGHSLVYYSGNSDGSFGPRLTIYTGASFDNLTILAGDFNGDGKIDFINQASGSYRFLQNMGGGSFSVGNQVQPTNSANFVGAKDFNNDGRTDTLGLGGSPRKLVIFYGQSDGTFTETAQSVSVQGINGRARVLELNGDNHPDVIEYDETSYIIYINDGTNIFSATRYEKPLGRAGGFVGNLIFEDFSGDNKADIHDYSNDSYNIFGEFVLLVKENICQPFGETTRANFNGDTLADLVTWNSNTGNWRIGILGTSPNNIPVSTLSFNWGAGALGDIPALGDYDGDGKTDYGVYRNSEGNWYVLLSSNSSWFVFRFGLPGDIPIPSDYDGGGKTDIAVFRPSDGNWYLWLTETQQFSAVHFGTSGDKPVAADYDGDGKTDIAVFRPSEGNWYYLKSSDSNYSVIHWGISTDIPVPADYDGDGRSDLAVYRDGGWYILRSTNNSFNFIPFGTAADFPTPSYRNGDLAELMVYRATNNFWYRYYFNSPPNSGITFGLSQYAPIYFGLPNN